MLSAERQSVWMSKITWRLNPVWHRMLYSCTHMATVGIKAIMRAFIVCYSVRCPAPSLNTRIMFYVSFLSNRALVYVERRIKYVQA